MQNSEHDQENWHLSQQWQARSQWVDFVLLVELHHFFVKFLAIIAMLLLQPLHFWLNLLHLQH